MQKIGHGRTKRMAALIGVALLIAVTSSPASAEYTGPALRNFSPLKKPWKIPATRFQNSKGQMVSIADYRGRVVLLHFWATTCHVCKYETPTVNNTAAKLKKEGLVVIAMPTDKRRSTVKKYRSRNKLTNMDFYFDPGLKFTQSIGIAGTPTTFIVDKNGYMVGFAEGRAAWDTPEALAVLRHFLSR